MEVAMKPARMYCGVCVDGAAVYGRVMIPANHEVCKFCLGNGQDWEGGGECEHCDGLGTIPLYETEQDIEE